MYVRINNTKLQTYACLCPYAVSATLQWWSGAVSELAVLIGLEIQRDSVRRMSSLFTCAWFVLVQKQSMSTDFALIVYCTACKLQRRTSTCTTQ